MRLDQSEGSICNVEDLIENHSVAVNVHRQLIKRIHDKGLGVGCLCTNAGDLYLKIFFFTFSSISAMRGLPTYMFFLLLCSLVVLA